MTALAWFLWAAVAWCLVLFGYARIYRPDDAEISRRFLRIHIACLAAIVGFELYWFLGIDPYGSRHIALDKQRRIEHQGFYTGPGGQFSFSGQPLANQFPAPSLGERERISFRPQAPAAPQTASAPSPAPSAALPLWTVAYRSWRYPLRLNETVRNVNDDWWIAPADTIELRAGNDLVTMAVRTEKSLFGRERQKLVFRFGRDVSGSRTLYGKDDVVLRAQPIHEGIAVGTLLRAAPADALGADGQVAGRLLELGDAVTVVRERRGDTASRLALLIDRHNLPGVHILKNGTELSAPVPNLRVESAVPAGTRLSYGLGDVNRFAITIPSKIEDTPELGLIVIADFLTPQGWPLPPSADKQFLISSRQEDSPADGYWIDVGGGERSFYAKTKLRPDLSALDLNTGSATHTYAMNDRFLLGDRVHGAVVALTSARQSIRYAGLLAIAVLIAAAIALALLLPDQDTPGTRMSIAYVLVWELSVLIVSVRLLLAFRASLLPPPEPRVASLFHSGLRVSLAAFAVVPFVLLLPLVFRRLSDRFFSFSSSTASTIPIWIWFPAQVLTGIVIAARIAGSPSLFGIRVNHLVIMGMLVVLAGTARYWTEFENWIARSAFVFFLSLPLVLNMFLLDDKGSYIYLIAFLIVGILQLAVHRDRDAGVLLKTGAIAAVLLLSMFPFVATSFGRFALKHRQIGPETETIYYRLIAQSAAETDILAQSADAIPISRQQLLRNVHQNWQMLLYATSGARKPMGFGAAPLTNRGMSYPVMLTDALFSQFIVSEHGVWASAAVIALYVLFAIVCLHAALFLPDGARHRLFLLVAAGSIFGLTALYMASGNIGIAVFTGLNIPFLGIYSGSDVALGCVISLLVASMFVWRTQTSRSTPIDDRPLLLTMVRTVMFGLGFWLLALVLSLYALRGTAADNHLKDYRLDLGLLKRLQDHLNPSPQKNPCWKRAGNAYVAEPGCTPTVLEKIAVDELNRRADKRDSRGGLLYLDGSRVEVNDNYFTVASPFREQDLWTGRILTAETSSDVGFVLLGKPLRLSLAPSGESSSVFLQRPVAQRTGRSILIGERPSQPRLCEIARMPNGQTWLSSKHVGGWQIFVDGDNVDEQDVPPGRACGQPSSRGCRRLAEGDVVVFERRELKELQQRYALLFVGSAPTPVLFTKWVNGRRRHILPYPALASVGYALAYAIDRMPASLRPVDLTVAVDPVLHAKLQDVVAKYARSDATYSDGDPFDGKRIGVAAVDASTGETLALSAWPVVDVRARDFEERLETTPSGLQYRLLQNPNYANHAIGSTIKPLVFTSVATALAPQIHLERMTVFNRADELDPKPDDVIHPHKRLAGLEVHDYWDCHSTQEVIDARSFLVRSRNYYEAMVGLIGLLHTPQEWSRAMRPATNRPPDLQYDAAPLTFDVTQVPNYPMTNESPSYARTETMKESMLFRTMPNLFSVSVGTASSAAYPDRCRTFLPVLCDSANHFPQNLIFAMPEPVMLQPQDFQELGQTYVRGFLVGGALSRWNNVTMAESIARIATGRRIESRMQAVPFGPQPFRPILPGPLGTTAWRTANLVEPLRDVVEDELGRGTAARLARVVPDRYTVMAKTGTIDEGDEGRESETFAAVVGPRINDEFVFGRTIAIYLYMEQAKTPNDQMKKFTLAEPVLRAVSSYVDGRAGMGVPAPTPEAPAVTAMPEPAAPPVVAAPAPPTGDASGIEGVLDRATEGVVGIDADHGSGTGFFVGDKCRIVTNNHVIANSATLSVVTHDGKEYPARVLAASAAKDIAILAVPVMQCIALPIETDRAHRGQRVYTIGYPFGFRESVTGGIVSAVAHPDDLGRTVIQTDAAVNPGNSGGPLINESGHVLGVTTYKLKGSEGMNFAIAVTELQGFASQLR